MADSKKGRKFWGEPYWKVLHCAAVTYDGTGDSTDGFLALVASYTKILPCKRCRAHFIENINRVPPRSYMESNHTLFFWTYLIHDLVNQQCNLQLRPGEERKTSPPYESIKAEYFSALGAH